MMLSKQEYISFIGEYIRPVRADLEAPLVAALDAMEFGAALPDPLLQSVVEAASSERLPIYELSTTVLGKLAERDRNALEAILKMSKARQSHVRHNALLCLTEEMPIELCVDIVRSALMDKSVRVRRKAADWAGRLKLKAVLPDMEKAEAIEPDEATRNTIGYELRMLRDGYFVEPPDGGVSYVTVNSPKGGRTTFRAKSSDIEERGIAVIVSEFLANKPNVSV